MKLKWNHSFEFGTPPSVVDYALKFLKHYTKLTNIYIHILISRFFRTMNLSKINWIQNYYLYKSRRCLV